MASREFLYLVKEESYGVPVTDPVLGTDAFYIRLDGSNGFDMQSNPNIQNVMYGGGRNTPAFGVSDQVTTTGQLQTKLYAGALSKFLLDWGITPINDDRDEPWDTTDASSVMPIGDLASVSCYHAIQLNDGTYDRRRYGGCKVLSGTVSSSRQSPIGELSLQLQGIRDDTNAAGSTAYPDDTEFPAPAETDYPSNPYLFSHTSTFLKIAATVTQYDSIQIAWQNTLDPRWFESKYAQMIRFLGRNSTLQVGLHLKASPDKRAAFQGLTSQDSEISFNNGTNSLKIDFNAKNLITALPWDLPIDKVYMQNLTLQNYWDPSAGVDIAVSGT